MFNYVYIWTHKSLNTYTWLNHLKSCFHVPCHACTSWNEGSQATHHAKNWSDNTTQWYTIRLRRSEYDGEGRNQQAVHSITVCQEQMPGWSIAGIKNTEWLVPFQWFNRSFSIWWLANHQCGQKKSVSAIIFGSIHNC